MSLVSRKVIKLSVFLFILNFPFVALSESDFSNNSEVEVLINELVLENGLDRQSLIEIFSKAQLKDSVLKLMTRPAEKIKPWFEYRDIFVSKSRIKNGLLFYQKNIDILTRAAKKFGVPPEIIVSIIGVETSYGTNTGSYLVIDALSTLAFHYPSQLKNYSRRKTYFTNELKNYLVLTEKQQLDPLALRGSYAGAMGFGQFMPSSYRNYAIDFDGDGRIDIWENIADAVGSVANYLAKHGWVEGDEIVVPADFLGNAEENWLNAGLKPQKTVIELVAMEFTTKTIVPPSSLATAIALEGEEGAEYWMGFKNFYVITRYNHSTMYALSVYQLAEAIKEKLIVAGQ